MLARLFQPFEQADARLNRRYGGAGLGLAIARGLIELMGGTIAAESVLDQGTRVSIGMPLVVEPIGLLEPLVLPEHARTMLIVDAHAATCEAIAGLVRNLGGEAWTATTLEEAMAAFQPGGPAAAAQVVLFEALLFRDAPEAAAAFVGQVEQRMQRVVFLGQHGQPTAPPPTGSAPASRGALTKPVRPSSLVALFRQDAQLEGGPRSFVSRPGEWHVLVVDDNSVNRLIARRMFERVGAMVAEASDGPDALALLAHTRPDLVLMDLQMPGMDGYEALAILRERERGLRRTCVVAFTAHASSDERAAARLAGFDDYLTKPLTAESVAECMRRNERAMRGRTLLDWSRAQPE
jgi:CheY-like chemotaxis protein